MRTAEQRVGAAPEPAGEVHTLAHMVLACGERGEDLAMRQLGAGTLGAGSTLTYRQLTAASREIARGLMALGIERGDMISILAETRAEWGLCEFGAFCCGAVIAPIYQTNSPEECLHVLSHAKARLVFCEDAAQAAKVAAIKDRCPDLEHVIVIEGAVEGTRSLEQLRRLGDSVEEDLVEQRISAVAPEDTATVVYTSGTTGPPKGCVLSHANLLSAVQMYRDVLELQDVKPTIYMFLPLAHVLARVAQMVVIDAGGTLVYWSRDPSRVLEEISEVQPTHFVAVPRIYEKIHTGVLSAVEAGGRPARLVFEWALEVGRRARPALRAGRPIGRVGTLRLRLADRLALGKVRSVFGARLEMALVGAAPIDQDLLEFFGACGVLVIEGYGMTENCAATTLNRPSAPRLGTVGPVLPGSEIRVLEDGEVVMRGPQVFGGYLHDPDATAASFKDGWLRTGDLGHISADGCLTVTGRQKDLIITSSGKNITPVEIENSLRESRWISEAVVFGDRRPYLVCMLTLEESELPQLAKRLGIPADIRTMASDQRVHELLQEEVDTTNERFARIEQIKRFGILDHELSQAEGEVTPTLKVKRAIVHSKYADFFDRLYQGEE